MSTTNRVNELADLWAFVVGHMALQAAFVAAVLVILAVWCRRWPAPIRHGLLLLALLKFVVPPVTNLPVGVFSVWRTEAAINETQTTNFPESKQENEISSVTSNPTPVRRTPSEKFEDGGTPWNIAEAKNERHEVVTMRDLLQPIRADKDSVDRSDSVANIGGEPNLNSRNLDLESQVVQHANSLADQTRLPTVASHLKTRESITVFAWLMSIHVIGSVVFAIALCWKFRSLRRFIISTVSAPEAVQANFEQLKSTLGCRSNIRLHVSKENISPFSTGVLSPVVVISEHQLSTLHADQLEAVLLHELVHHHRNDLVVCWCQAIVTVLWWFHPAAWIVNRQIRGLREDCCDDFLLCRKSVEADVYCETLLNVAKGCNGRSKTQLVMTVSMAHGVHSLNSRFRRIMNDSYVRSAGVSLAGAMGLFAVALLFIPGMTSAVSLGEDSALSVVEPSVPAIQRAEAKTRPESSDPLPETAPASVVPILPATTKSEVKVAAKWPKSIRVNVLNSDGKPIANAKVTHSLNRIKTDFTTATDGTVTLPIPEDHSNIAQMSIIVNTAPYLVFGKYWYPQRSPRRSVDAEYEFRLEEDGQTIGGRVVNTDNQPIAGAKVSVYGTPENGNRRAPRPTSHTFVAETDENGYWAQDRIPKSLQSLTLQIQHPDYISNPDPVWIQKDLWPVLFEQKYQTLLKTGTLLSGKVTDTEGNPIAGVMLRLGSGFPNAHADIPVTDADGNFRFPHCEQQTQPVVTTWKDGFAPELQSVIIGETPANIEFQIKPASTVRIQVVDPEGHPVKGVRVYPDTWREHRSLAFASRFFKSEYPITDDTGLWVWPNAPEDEVRYSAYKQGWRRISRKPLLPGDEAHRIVMRPELIASGVVLDAESGDPIPEFELIPGSDRSFEQHRMKKATDGTFKIAFDDSYEKRRLRFEAKGYASEVVTVDDNPTNSVQLNVSLRQQENPCFVIVTNQAGEPEPDTRLIIATQDNRAYIRANLVSGQQRGITLTTDELGRVQLPHINEPCSIIAISKTGFALLNVAASELQSGELQIKTTPTTRIEGTMKREGVALPGELIELEFDDHRSGSLAHFDFDAKTDVEGRFVFKQVPSGKLVRVFHTLIKRNGTSSTHHRGATTILTTKPGETVALELGRVGKYRFHGKFAYDDGNGTVVDWTKYHASLSEDRESRRKANDGVRYLPDGNVRLQADGSFEVNGLDEGSYQIFFSTSLSFNEQHTKDKLASGTTRQSFRFPSDNSQDEIDLGTMTVYPSQPMKQTRFQPISPLIADIVSRSLSAEGEFELEVTTKNGDLQVIPEARVTLWYGHEGPAQRVTRIADASGVAAFKKIPSHGAWMFVEADGYRFHAQTVDAAHPGSLAKSTVRLMSDADAPTPLATLPMRVTPDVRNAAMASLAKFAGDSMAGKAQWLRHETERLLAKYSPELAIKTHQSNTIDFGGVTNDPQGFSHWHDTVVYSFAAGALLKSDPLAAERAIEMVVDDSSRSRVYSTAAKQLPEMQSELAIKWLRIAESLARKPGKESLPLGERLAYIAAGYRQHNADADAWRVLKDAAIEATKNPDSDRFDYGKRQVAKHLAAYDSGAALALIGFEFDNPPPDLIDVAAFGERVKSSEPGSPQYEQLIEQIRDSTSQDEQLGDIVVTLANIRPDVAESLLRHLRMLRDRYAPQVAYRMASADLERAIRVAELTTNESYRGQAIGAVADAISTSDPQRSRLLLGQAFKVLAAAKTPEDTRLESPLKMAVSLLPTVEKIDRTLISEYIYRTLALRQTDTCGGNCCVPINTLGRTGERNFVRLADPVLAAAIARYDMTLARTIASAPGDTTLQLSIKEAPYFLLGALARTNPENISFGAINRIASSEAFEAWTQILPALTLNNDEYWSWLMDEQFGVWEIGKAE